MIVYICDMNGLSYNTLLQNYSAHEVSEFQNRYLSYDQLQTYFKKKVFSYYTHQSIGESELKRSIDAISLGQGQLKILIWSQMHGNESTTTKAILDVLHYIRLNSDDPSVKQLLERCTLKIIPMLNPDGATAYTRVNANKTDLNRDAINRSQSETQAFFKVLEQFKPDYCFNMHGQRTMFSAGAQEYPATLSFLSPSVDKERSVNATRKTAMRLISAANDILQEFIPHQVGRYDDAYNPNCFGDHIQSKGIPTVLFEAGHYPNDYHRNKTRQLVFISVLEMLRCIAQHRIDQYDHKRYFDIPMNEKLFFDCIIANASNTSSKAIGLSFKEVLEGNTISFLPQIKEIGDLNSFFALKYIDAKGQNILTDSSRHLKVGKQLDMIQLDGDVLPLKF